MRKLLSFHVISVDGYYEGPSQVGIGKATGRLSVRRPRPPSGPGPPPISVHR
jgi:hypothetical protein